MYEPLVYIVTLNWNGFSDTSELLESLSGITYKNFKIVVVDNNSSKDDVDKLKKYYDKKTHIILLKENLGYAGGNNIGIKHALEANADFILLINNDTKVEPDFLSPLVNKFNTYSDAGIIAPRINYYDMPNKIWSDGGKISWLRASGFAYSDKLESNVNDVDKSVTFASGCCMLIKKQLLLDIGLFDENFFLYTEDTDLCFRTIKKGYEIYVIPKAKIYHKVNKSTKNNFESLPLYYTTRNRLYFAKKHFKKSYRISVSYMLVTMFLKSILWFIQRDKLNIVAVRNAFEDFNSVKMGPTDHSLYFK